MNNKWFIIVFMAIWVIGGVFAQVILVKPSEAIIVNASILNVNSSDYWDNLDIPNATQMENSGGTLNILESWLTTFVNSFSHITATNVAFTNQSNTFTLNQTFNQNISVSDTGFFTNLGTAISRITKGWFTDLDVSGNLTDGTNNASVLEMQTAYDHSQNNTQAHSDYLLNTGDTGTGDYVLDGAVTINEAGADKDFRVEAVGAPNALFVDGATGRIGINDYDDSPPLALLHLKSQLSTMQIFEQTADGVMYGFGSQGGYFRIKYFGSLLGGSDSEFMRMGINVDINHGKKNIDFKYSGDTTANIFVLDAGLEEVKTLDNIPYTMGTGGDAKIYYNGTNLIFNTNVTGSGNAWFSRGLSVSENATFNKNVIINKNLFVQGCIVYNMSGTSVTLGDCI